MIGERNIFNEPFTTIYSSLSVYNGMINLVSDRGDQITQ